MSGHSKWSSIKHKKALTDAQKSKHFGKMAKQITIVAKESGSDPNNNPKLKSVIEKARGLNMPSSNIERAIKRAQSKESGSLENVLFEAYGPAGIAILASGVTDNKNRTTQEIKHLLSEYGVSLASPGAARFLFTKTDDGWRPQTTIEISEGDQKSLEKIFEALDNHDDIDDIYTNAKIS